MHQSHNKINKKKKKKYQNFIGMTAQPKRKRPERRHAVDSKLKE
jgi:hypothetical protein